MIAVELDDPRWLRFVQAFPDALPAHHPAWAKVLSDCYGFRPFTLLATRDGDRVEAGLPMLEVTGPLGGRRWISLPFTDYCPPLVEREAEVDLARRLDAARRRAGIPVVEVRGALAGQGVHCASDAVLHTLRLAHDPASVFRTFKRTQVQQRIAKAEREGVVIRRGSSPADVRVFYHLHVQTRRRLGVPVQPRRFFDLLFEALIDRGLAFLLLAYAGATPVAGAVFLAWNRTISYKYSASDARFLRYRPNNLILWTAIRWGCENGYRLFDFGRTKLEDEGLRHFKSGWGTDEMPLTYCQLAERPWPNRVARGSRAARTVLRHSPLVVTRLVGELFYRYAA